MNEELKNVDGKEKKSEKAMYRLLAETQIPPKVGEIVSGEIIAIDRASIYVDLPPFGTGIIYGREYINARDVVKNSTIGDIVTATIVDLEGMEGYIELSLKEARQAIIWGEAEKAIKNKTVFELLVKEANKGGLIIEWQGVLGFLPASQLTGDHYPRVENGDKDKILIELQKLVETHLAVTIITADPKEGKLIFSERGPVEEGKKELVQEYAVGDTVEGEVTGVVDFGVFIKIQDNLEGLAHISELDWGLVEDPRNLFSIGEKVKARVIEVKDDKISLSIKALKENPWTTARDKYTKGQTVEGVVIKHNKHGALVAIEEGVAGLVHVSEFESPEELKTVLELGKNYPFTINLFEPEEQRMTLSYTKKKA
jgi:small subunit ribosomal protein S1